MSDFIKREDALNALREYPVTKLKTAIRRLPSADVAPVMHGHWTHERLPSTSGGSYSVIRCSECQRQVPIYETRFCPNCGAFMDKDGDEDDD